MALDLKNYIVTHHNREGAVIGAHSALVCRLDAPGAVWCQDCIDFYQPMNDQQLATLGKTARPKLTLVPDPVAVAALKPYVAFAFWMHQWDEMPREQRRALLRKAGLGPIWDTTITQTWRELPLDVQKALAEVLA